MLKRLATRGDGRVGAQIDLPMKMEPVEHKRENGTGVFLGCSTAAVGMLGTLSSVSACLRPPTLDYETGGAEAP
jgi:hypothetical protein